MEAAHLVQCFLLCLQYVCVSAAAWDLVLLHTNDVHARVEETSRESGKCTKGSCFAGVSRRATKIKEIRSREENVLLLDAGDQFQGTVWFNVYKGLEAAHFMNKLGYDAMALGNHEFDNGVEGLKPFLHKVNCTVLSANARPDDTLASQVEGLYLPYAIFHVNGERVGVVGYTSKETPALSQPGPHMQFEDEVNSMQPHVDKLLTLGVNKIIALGHSGFIMDQHIAKKLRGVDVVIGGHSNTFLYTGSPKPSSEIPAGPYPFMVRSDYGGDVPVVQAYAFGKYLGYLRVSFDEAGNVLRSTGNPILLDSAVAEDPAIRGEVDKWKRSLANYSATYVGMTLVYLNGTADECRYRECNLGNLICDAMIDNNIKYADELQWNHVSSCIYNSGGIRNAIDERARNGSITMEDLISVMPFGGTLDLVELRGSTLWKAFEHSVWRYGQGAGEFLQVSGFRVEYDVSKMAGRRVKSLRILCTNCRVPHYEPVEQELLYKVVLPSYLVMGGDGYSMIKQEKLKHDSGDLDIAVLSNFIAERKKIHPSVEGRIRISSSASGLSATTASVILTGLFFTLYGSL